MKQYNELPPQEYLNECFDYNPETGILIWKHRPRYHYQSNNNYIGSNKRFVGTIAGKIKDNGYLTVKVNDVTYSVHRLVWKLVTGEEPKGEIDHINNVRHDNRWCNLREATDSENARNRLMRKDNTSGVKGVCWDKESSKWLAQIWDGKRNVKVGRFGRIEDAEEAIRLKRIEMYGDFHNHGEYVSPYGC